MKFFYITCLSIVSTRFIFMKNNLRKVPLLVLCHWVPHHLDLFSPKFRTETVKEIAEVPLL